MAERIISRDAKKIVYILLKDLMNKDYKPLVTDTLLEPSGNYNTKFYQEHINKVDNEIRNIFARLIGKL